MFNQNSNNRNGSRRRDGYHSPRPYRAQQERRARRVKQLPAPPKPCYVMVGKSFTHYDEKYKHLVASSESGAYRFPSRKKARIAIWHTCQKRVELEGISPKDLALQYAIVDA